MVDEGGAGFLDVDRAPLKVVSSPLGHHLPT